MLPRDSILSIPSCLPSSSTTRYRNNNIEICRTRHPAIMSKASRPCPTLKVAGRQRLRSPTHGQATTYKYLATYLTSLPTAYLPPCLPPCLPPYLPTHSTGETGQVKWPDSWKEFFRLEYALLLTCQTTFPKIPSCLACIPVWSYRPCIWRFSKRYSEMLFR